VNRHDLCIDLGSDLGGHRIDIVTNNSGCTAGGDKDDGGLVLCIDFLNRGLEFALTTVDDFSLLQIGADNWLIRGSAVSAVR
jgi:hypothetical protein